jgi:CRISPR-associated endonuclease/helicase Cas3
MENMYNSINNIGSELLGIFENKEYQEYLAHISKNQSESIFEHLSLVKEYSKTLKNVHGLGRAIDHLVNDFVSNNYSNHNIAKDFIKDLFDDVIIFHDFGKLNPDFQRVKMKNNNFTSINNSLGSDHSKISAFTFIFKYLNLANNERFADNEKIINNFLVYSFSFPILKHHSSSITYSNEFYFTDEFVSDLYSVIDKKLLSFPKDQISNIGKMLNKRVLNEIDNKISKHAFNLFALLKLNYSLLTASDYYATSHFMSGWKKKPNDFGVFTNDLKKKIVNNIKTSTLYNKKAYEELNNYKVEFPKEPNGKNLNKLRQNLSVEIINGIRANIDKNLFYIEAPTGGGKTNLSMLALAEFLRNDLNNGLNNITKVFYVFPYTTLITQTFKSLKKTLSLNVDEIVQIHSKAGFSEKSKDGDYGNEKDNIIDYQFVNYPIALLSHIKFFDILKSNKKSTNYLMHRIANSVVIIDELQTYSPKEWDKVIYFINNYAKYFNIKFILMSATLPKIDKLLSSEAEKTKFKKQEFVLLNQNKDKYFKNPNFVNRVEFDFEMINDSNFDKKYREKYLQKLWQKVRVESKSYKNKNNRVHTIIEFIFKKTASEFIEIANDKNELFDEIFILSGTILEPRRKEIIARLKSDDYQSKNILLITTQVVEAGVDIDMDLGFKDSSLIDSDEQLAGRINRNANKPQCKLYMFDLDDAKVIYGEDDRYKKIENELKNEYSEILKTKNFDKVYNSVMKDRNELNKSDDFINLKDYLSSIRKLDFTSVDKDFKLINNEISNVTIYVPIEIEIDIPNSKEKNFTKTELNFLKENDKYKTNAKTVSGEYVWELFDEAIKYKNEDFVSQKKRMITLQGLMSKFSFSVGTYSKAFKQIELSGRGEMKFGYYKLNFAEDVYDYKTGIKVLKFEDINFL